MFFRGVVSATSFFFVRDLYLGSWLRFLIWLVIGSLGNGNHLFSKSPIRQHFALADLVTDG